MLSKASILHDLSDMQPQINAIKIEHPPYYCSSYTPPSAATAADHAQPAASFSPPPVHQLIRNDKTEKPPTVSVSSAPTFSPVLRPEDGHRGMDSPHSQTGLHSPHEGLAGGSGQSMSGLAYYQPEHPASAGVVKYPENGHDTLSDFVTFVCQEAENTQQLPQVASGSFEAAPLSTYRQTESSSTSADCCSLIYVLVRAGRVAALHKRGRVIFRKVLEECFRGSRTKATGRLRATCIVIRVPVALDFSSSVRLRSDR
ncbi:uncharacterized protein LOC128892701 [Hylaeus anthracinus]|nr:uncharacterized protein LOC128892701 [Hylaeus anthracinus]